VGAGIAGIACARRLREAEQPYLLISENLGGRITRSRDGAVNLGAYYVRADYDHVNALVDRGRRIRVTSTRRHVDGKTYTYADPRLLMHLPQAVRFLRQLVIFRRHYRTLKTDCLVMSQARAIRADPLLWHLYRQPAADFVREHRVEDIARDLLAPGLRATTFQPLRNLTAFVMLLGSLPILEPTYEFTLNPGALGGDRARAFLQDSVTSITPDASGYRLETARSGPVVTDLLVVATPPHVAQRLLGLAAKGGAVPVHMFEMSGRLRSPWNRGRIHMFGADDPTFGIARQSDGSILFCSKEPNPPFDRFFTSWDVVEHKHWNPAFNLSGANLVECELQPGLYVAGDYNVCGLEDAYLTGLYAANQIIDNRSGRRTHPQTTPLAT
jgi:hypothetical protein